MDKWKTDLASFFQSSAHEQQESERKRQETNSAVAVFYSTVVAPAFEDLRAELERHGRSVIVTARTDYASITVHHEDRQEIRYDMKVNMYPGRAFPSPQIHFTDPSDGKPYRAEGHLRSGAQDYTIADIGKEEIIRHFLSEYMVHARRR